MTGPATPVGGRTNDELIKGQNNKPGGFSSQIIKDAITYTETDHFQLHVHFMHSIMFVIRVPNFDVLCSVIKRLKAPYLPCIASSTL
jgi:hypothetical protein